MQRRSQGSEDLADFHQEITAFERSNRKGASARSEDEGRMEFGEGSGGGNAAHYYPDTTAEGAGDSQGEPRVHNDPTRRNPPARARCRDDNGDNVRIGTFDEPGTRSANTGIVAPRIPVNNFEMKQGLMNAIRSLEFHGRPSDNPLDHLDTFDRLCNMYKVSNVPLDTIRMMMFPFSLADGAAVWEREIPSELVSNWDDVKKEFLNAFFPKQKTAKIRGDIASFKQRSHESFAQAWDRMRRYIRGCPHHGFTRDSILGIFYRGCDAATRMHLDSASGGCFSNNTVKEGENIITNLAKSNSQNYDDEDDYDRDDAPTNSDARVLKEMHRKLDLVLKSQANRKEVSFVGQPEKNVEYDGEEFDDNEEMNYIDNNQGFQNRGYQNQGYNNQPFKNNYGEQRGAQSRGYNGFNHWGQQPSATSNYQNSPQSSPPDNNEGDVIARIGNLIRKATSEHTRLSEETNHMLVKMTHSVESRIDAWECRMDDLEKRLTMAESQLTDVTTAAAYVEKGDGSRLSRDYCQLADEPNTPEETKKHVYHIKIICDDDIKAGNKNCKEKTESDSYVRPLPFPGTILIAKQQKRDYDKASAALKTMEESEVFKEIMSVNQDLKDHHEKLTACKQWFETRTGHYGLEKPYPVLTLPINYFDILLKKMDTGKQEPNINSCKPTNKKPDPLKLSKTREIDKKDSLGSFTTACVINNTPVNDCVIDLETSRCTMPLHLGTKILTKEMRKTNATGIFTDGTKMKLAGFACNIPVTLHGQTIPANFLITDTKDPGSKVVLGRSFLALLGAKIKDKEEKWINSCHKIKSENTGNMEKACRTIQLKPPWQEEILNPDHNMKISVSQ